MPKFAANLTLLFTELPFPARFAAAARAGFTAVEFLFPYEFPAEDIRRELDRHGLEAVLFNLHPGDFAAGERGLAALPGREKDFAATVELGLEYARVLGCGRVHAMSGVTPADAPRKALEALWVNNMRFAADRLGAHGLTVLAEPLNPRDNPGYFLIGQDNGARLVRRADRPNFRLQVDLYHAQITDGDLTAHLRSLGGLLGHVQIASVPDRHEPDEGELNYVHLFRVLDEIGYDGWVGCEYRPRGTTESGLNWLKTLL